MRGRRMDVKKRDRKPQASMQREDLKQASPKAANIHNRWWRERSERNLRLWTFAPFGDARRELRLDMPMGGESTGLTCPREARTLA